MMPMVDYQQIGNGALPSVSQQVMTVHGALQLIQTMRVSQQVTSAGLLLLDLVVHALKLVKVIQTYTSLN